MLSHRSAAAVWGILNPGETIDVTVPRRRRRELDGVRVHRPSTTRKSVIKQGLPITTVGQTLVDLATTEPASELERALNETRVTGLASARQLSFLADRQTSGRGART